MSGKPFLEQLDVCDPVGMSGSAVGALMERTARFFLLLHRFDDRSADGGRAAVREPGALPNELCRDSILRTVGDNWFFVVVGTNHGGSGLCFAPRTRVGEPDGCAREQDDTQDPAQSGRTESHILQA